jgi:hypothetical protein
VVGNGVAAEGDAARRADRLVGERLVGDPRARAQRLDPLVHEAGERPRLDAGDEGDLLALLGLDETGELVGDLLLGLGPRRRRAGDESAPEAVGMIEALHRGLAADAQGAGVHRVVGVALELDDAPVAIACQHAAARRTFATDRGEVRDHARNDVLGGRDVREEGLGGGAASTGRHRGPSRGHDLEERPAIDAAHLHALLTYNCAMPDSPERL